MTSKAAARAVFDDRLAVSTEGLAGRNAGRNSRSPGREVKGV
jgi:hypothetical protein